MVGATLLFTPVQTSAFPAREAGATTVTETIDADGKLPFARGHQFGDLDSYLEHRRKLGFIDLPFYERQRDGTYRYVTPFVDQPDNERAFTRAELMKQFGFER
jgi:hypothetical protein